jgi:hypothetical protein
MSLRPTAAFSSSRTTLGLSWPLVGQLFTFGLVKKLAEKVFMHLLRLVDEFVTVSSTMNDALD